MSELSKSFSVSTESNILFICSVNGIIILTDYQKLTSVDFLELFLRGPNVLLYSVCKLMFIGFAPLIHGIGF
jgi:hypothetical protein